MRLKAATCENESKPESIIYLCIEKEEKGVLKKVKGYK